MKKGIGPNNLGAPKGVGKMYKAAPAKKTGDGKKPIVNTDEMGRKGSFNISTEDGIKLGETDYSQPYQNKELSFKSQKKRGIRGYTIGDQETEMKSKFRRDNVIGMRAEAYMAKENNFGVKKPKVNIK